MKSKHLWQDVVWQSKMMRTEKSLEQEVQKNVLITGGSSGIGFALAKQFAADGYGIVLVSSNERKLQTAKQKLVKDFEVPIFIYVSDLTQKGAAEALYRTVKEMDISIDVLVNNAGIGTIGATESIPVLRDEELMVLNMITPVTLTKLFLKEMYQRKAGKILNVCSTGAFQPGPYTATYYASKSFLLSYTKAVRYEAKAHGVTVCALCPGTTATEFFSRAKSETPKGAMTADAVAAYGYKQFMRKKEVIIPGLSYRLMKLFPEKIKTAVIALVKQPK